MLGGVDTDDGKVFTTNFLDTWTDHSIRFLQRLPAWLCFVLHTAGSSDVVRHVGFSVIGESKGADLNFPPQQSKLPILQKKYFGDLKRHTWGDLMELSIVPVLEDEAILEVLDNLAKQSS